MNKIKTISKIVLYTVLVGILVFSFIHYCRKANELETAKKEVEETKRQYNELASRFKRLVEKRIITDILIVKGKIFVIIRNKFRELHKEEISVNLNKEIYVDYIVYEDHIILRRIFDAGIPPEKAVNLLNRIHIDFDKVVFGKAIYKRFKEDGLYHITVTGNGSIGIQKADVNDSFEYIEEPEMILEEK